ncbi:hypothetical protein GCM10010270_46810 [Streptomyces violaceus]|nr:hypothetical protein GCM10010270_46810 [Streptomyces janthinus]
MRWRRYGMPCGRLTGGRASGCWSGWAVGRAGIGTVGSRLCGSVRLSSGCGPVGVVRAVPRAPRATPSRGAGNCATGHNGAAADVRPHTVVASAVAAEKKAGSASDVAAEKRVRLSRPAPDAQVSV